MDYWDYLGWKDPFGDARYSLRQRAYAGIMKEARVYTPQMIVNGERAMVGSDRDRVNRALREGASRPPKRLTVQTQRRADDGAIAATVTSEVLPENGDVWWIAVAEDNLTSQVTRGENTGKTLTHHGVVRFFDHYGAHGDTAQLTASIPWQDDWKPAQIRVVVGLQSERHGTLRALGQSTPGASE